MGHCKSSAKGKVHSTTGLPQEIRKSQINNLTLHLKQLETEEMKTPSVSRWKEILKIRAELGEPLRPGAGHAHQASRACALPQAPRREEEAEEEAVGGDRAASWSAERE